MTRARALPPTPATCVWAAVALGWTLALARYGPGMTADTMDYVGIGRPAWALHPDVFQWPPVFWLVLQWARTVGLSSWTAAVAAMCLARVLLATGALRLGWRLAGPLAGHAFAAATFVWVPLTYAGLYALSDVLFLGFAAWWLAAAHAVRPDAPDLTGRVWRTTFWAALMAGTRFVGAPLALVEWAVGTLLLRRAGTRQWLTTALLSGACILGPALGWMGVGRAVSGQAVGERHPSRFELNVHLQNVGTAWWDPLVKGRYGDIFWGDAGGGSPVPPWAQAILYVAVLALAWCALQPRRGGAPLWRTRLAAAAALYLLVLIVSSARVWIDPIGPRFLMPLVLLALAGLVHPLRAVRRTRSLRVGLSLLLGLWAVDACLRGSVAPRFGVSVLALLGFGGALVCLAAAWLDPRPPRRPAIWERPTYAALLLGLAASQAAWSCALVTRVARAELPSIQHPGWRGKPEVAALRAHIRPGDTVYTHTVDAVRAVLDDRRDVHVEALCFDRLSYDCGTTLDEYLASLDARARTATEWIVLCDRVFVPYLFLDELRARVHERPHVQVFEVGTVHAFGWPPSQKREHLRP